MSGDERYDKIFRLRVSGSQPIFL